MRFRNLIGGLAALLVMAGSAEAHQIKSGDLVLHHPWSRATPPGAQVGGGYLTIENKGKAADRLIGGTFEASKTVEIHEMTVKDGVMTMRPLTQGIEIPPGGSVTLKPGGMHLMLMGLKRQLNQDDQINGTLVFEKAGTVKVEFEVESMGTKDAGHDANHDMGHGAGQPAQ